jgi:hypothetical protein
MTMSLVTLGLGLEVTVSGASPLGADKVSTAVDLAYTTTVVGDVYVFVAETAKSNGFGFPDSGGSFTGSGVAKSPSSQKLLDELDALQALLCSQSLKIARKAGRKAQATTESRTSRFRGSLLCCGSAVYSPHSALATMGAAFVRGTSTVSAGARR